MIGVQGIIPHMEVNGKKKNFYDIYNVYKWTFNKSVYLGKDLRSY